MWLKSVRLRNIKGFVDSGILELSKGINVIVGSNNAGKSTILKCIQVLQPLHQTPNDFLTHNRRKGTATDIPSEILLELEAPAREQLTTSEKWDFKNWKPSVQFSQSQGNFMAAILGPNGNMGKVPNNQLCHSKEPHNFIYPYFSRRKPPVFNLQITHDNAHLIEDSFQHLPSKVDRLLNADSPYFDSFRNACESILGLKISCSQYANGKHAGIMLQDGTLLPIDHMGEGIVHVLAFLAHLCPAKGKLFVIEEIENDLHPKALKRLLEFIIEKSDSNQFVISTHSNIVLRYLGGASGSRVFKVSMQQEANTRIPVCTCDLVPETPSARLDLLDHLGYDIFDSFLWKGYLILEESTAERVIREVLIPLFFPQLGHRLKTIAAQGVQDIELRVRDISRLFLFIHLEPVYRGRGWVAVDGGDYGQHTITHLRKTFGQSWPPEHFRAFSEAHFESYYPSEFKQRVAEVLALPHGLDKQSAKGKLAEDVVKWALADPNTAMVELAVCAKDVISLLSDINSKLAG